MLQGRRSGAPTWARRALLVAGVVLGLLLVAYVAAYAAAGSGIARGTTVLGVAVGGMSREEAARTLTRELQDRTRGPVPVRVDDETARVRPAAAGLRFDVEATVDSARARSWNPADLLDALVGGDEVAPVVDVDRPALREAVARLADRVDREAVDGQVRIRGTEVRPVAAHSGVRLRQAAAARALTAGWLDPARPVDRPVVLPARTRAPAVGQAAVDAAVSEVATPALAEPVSVTVEGRTVELTPEDVGAALTFEPDGGELVARLDGESLHAAVTDDLEGVEDPARDAGFEIVDGRPQVVPSRPGREVLPQTLADAVLPVLGETGPARSATVPLEVSEPNVSTEQARGLGVVEKVSEFTTYYPSDFAGRLTNIHRAADLMDDTLVLPGEVFSFNDTVGERTAERGFAPGFIIEDGRLEVDYGGGVSQLATTTFNAAFFAGLEIVEHNPHSFYISRYPEGRESTIAWGVKDLRFRNDSGHGVFVTTSWTSSSVTVQMWGTKVWRIESQTSARYDVKGYETVYDPRPEGVEAGSCVATEGVPGFKVVVTRLFYQGDQQVRSERFRTTYDPEDRVVCGTSGPS